MFMEAKLTELYSPSLLFPEKVCTTFENLFSKTPLLEFGGNDLKPPRIEPPHYQVTNCIRPDCVASRPRGGYLRRGQKDRVTFRTPSCKVRKNDSTACTDGKAKKPTNELDEKVVELQHMSHGHAPNSKSVTVHQSNHGVE
jgi:hypothetical protein